jgi:predicted CxxxxCH...CXXCH cytochrome family protein
LRNTAVTRLGTVRAMRTALLVSLLCSVMACADDGMTDDPLPPNADVQAGCSINCHGDELSNAPPKSVSGAVETTSVSVGAHRAHVGISATWHRQVECADCHVVPAEVGSPGHLDGDNKAELTFSMVAGMNSTWTGSSCMTRCHGSAALGGARPNPMWTVVDGTQSACGSCHGAPPPAPHTAATNCASCHPTMEEGSLTFRDPASHINGVVDVVGAGATGGCTSCHGSPTSSAPPKDLSGDTLPAAAGVGAHVAHLSPSNWHQAIQCAACHVVPTTRDAPGHRDGDNLAEIVFTALNPVGAYARATTSCSNTYCHSNGRGGASTVSWVSETDLTCTSCHAIDGTNMSGQHRRHIRNEGLRCSQCHQDVVNAQRVIVNANLHVNGAHEVKMAAGTYNPATRSCSNTGCHETERW